MNKTNRKKDKIKQKEWDYIHIMYSYSENVQ